MLRLEAREATMGEIADAAIFETRLFVDVEAGEVDGILLRHNVAVPEPVASTAPFEEVVETIPDAAEI